MFNANKTERINSMLSALERSTLDQEVKDMAINHAFVEAFRCATDNRASLAKDYFDHPAVLADDYSNALYRSYKKRGFKSKLFKWLLEKADLGDLEAVKNEEKWEYMPKKFKVAIDKALKTVEPGRTRAIPHDIRAAEKAFEKRVQKLFDSKNPHVVACLREQNELQFYKCPSHIWPEILHNFVPVAKSLET